MTAGVELLELFRGLSTPLVSDCIEACGHRAASAAPGLLPLHDSLLTVVGFAHPCLVRRTSERVEIDELLRYVDIAGPDTLAVVGADPDLDCAIWGGLMSAAVQRRGCVGALVDGPVRDVADITELSFPVWATGRSPLDIRGRGQVTAIGEAVTFRGLVIEPGQVIVADANGVVAIPLGAEVSVAEACQDRRAAEITTQLELRAGGRPADVYARHRAF